ncbi:MAG TPA: glycosyltransferase [Solirubrobacteraceae bacterium]|jgi:glycosyltransferase involved in cell wall biosynthesis|nr:glycosyltransferase [Solirubrobacteraceae bacterium]
MRVLVTLPWGERLGGAEAMLQAILDGAGGSGHELELVFFKDGPWPRELAAAGFRVDVLRAGKLREAHRGLATVLRLAALLRRRRPDLVLNWAAKTQLYGAPAAMLAGIGDRVVWWQQNVPDGAWIDRAATLLPARAVGCYSRAAARAQEQMWPRRRTFVVAAGARPVQGRASSESSETELKASRSRVQAETEREQTPPLQAPGVAAAPLLDTPVVGIVGRLQPWKGQDRLLEAHALLRERGVPVRTLIVGGDAYGLSPQYAASLAPLAQRLGLDGEVELTGQVPDAGPYIERMDVLVNASDPEPFGIVLLEAMARGVPVVAVNSGGPAEFVKGGETGALARSGEPEALADALEPLLRSPALRERLGAAGRERFLAEFTDAALRRRFFAALTSLQDPDRRREVGAAATAESGGGERQVTIVAHDIGSVGGMERQLAELIRGLCADGWDVTAIARTCALGEGENGVRFHRVRAPARPLLLAYPWFLLAGSLALRRHRRGVVQATGGIVLNRLDAVAIHCCHQVYRPEPQRSGVAFRRYAGATALVSRLGERLCLWANRPERVVCVSEGVAAEVREHYPRLAARVQTIHNGVDTELFAPATHERAAALRADQTIAPGRLLAAFVGTADKGLATVLAALREAPEWDLLVAGRGHVERSRELAVDLGVAGRVRWLGVVQDIQRVYGAADAFVLASDYETFSLVSFEAAASGLPVVATPVSGVSELIVDGQSGFLVRRRAGEIAERLRRLGSDASLRERLGYAARERAREFSWERMMLSHERLYSELAGARPRSAAAPARPSPRRR